MAETDLTELKKKVEKVEERVDKLQSEYNGQLNQIFQGITRIEGMIENRKTEADLQRQISNNHVADVEERVDKLEANQRWVVLAVLGEILAVVFMIVKVFIERGM